MFRFAGACCSGQDLVVDLSVVVLSCSADLPSAWGCLRDDSVADQLGPLTSCSSLGLLGHKQVLSWSVDIVLCRTRDMPWNCGASVPQNGQHFAYRVALTLPTVYGYAFQLSTFSGHKLSVHSTGSSCTRVEAEHLLVFASAEIALRWLSNLGGSYACLTVYPNSSCFFLNYKFCSNVI